MTFSFGVRLTLLIFSFNEVDQSIPAIFAIFAIGLLSDLMACLALSGLLWVGYSLVPSSWFNKRQFYFFTMVLLFILGSMIVFGVICELLYWFKFGSRFDFASVAYLLYPTEVFGNLKASYPTGLLTIIIFLVSSTFCYIVYKYNLLHLSTDETKNESRKPFLLIILPIVLSFLYLIKSFQINSLPNKYNRELAQNGTISFLMAFRSGTINFKNYYQTLPKQEVLTEAQKQVLKQPDTSLITPTTSGIDRKITSKGPEKHWNIIHITLESMSLEYTAAKSTHSLTPFIYSLAKKSLYFSNYYAVGERTVRGLEGLTLGTMPTLGQSILKRENITKMPALTDVLHKKGYKLQFIYPGHAQFDNMDKFYKRLNFQIIDLTSPVAQKRKFTNIWGASDEDLYRWTIDKANENHKTKQPFYQLLMTISNHQPFFYPKYPEEEGYIASEVHTNIGAIKYSDYALKQFFKQAKKQPWFKDTIFVINADHCASTPNGWSKPVEKYQIPLIIYAPSIIKPQIVNTLCCQIDTLPTVFGLLNWSYINQTFGQDILKIKKNDGRAVFSNYQTLSYIYKNKMVSLLPGGENRFFTYTEDGATTPIKRNIQLEKTAISLYQTAGKILENHQIRSTKNKNHLVKDKH
jgi:phosphoglycerol transferase MdoB-like AlkP superfamily enzyme